MYKGYKNSQGNGIFREDNTVSKSTDTPPQTASDYWDRPTGWGLLLPPWDALDETQTKRFSQES